MPNATHDNDNGSTVITRGRPGKYDEETIKKAMAILQGGGTLQEAAEATDMTVQAVQYHKRKYGVRGPRDTSMPSVRVADPLAASEERLFVQFDEEITRHEEMLLKVSERLKNTMTRRNNLAVALGRPKRELKVKL